MNSFKTFILMLIMTVLLVVVGNLIGGRQGMVTAFAFAAVMNLVSYWFSDKIVLAMYGAKEAKRDEFPQIYSIVEKLTLKGKMPMPKVYIMNTNMANAFATGRDPQHAAVAVTTGILGLLNEEELEGVISHELSHVKHRDILIGTVAATFAGAIFMLARTAQFAAMFGGGGRDRNEGGNPLGLIAVAIIAPLAATIIQMAISRSREYLADASGAELSGNPKALANALRKLSDSSKQIQSNVNPTTAHMFIVSPFNGRSLVTLFSTHPPVEKRIKALEIISESRSGYKIPNIIY